MVHFAPKAASRVNAGGAAPAAYVVPSEHSNVGALNWLGACAKSIKSCIEASSIERRGRKLRTQERSKCPACHQGVFGLAPACASSHQQLRLLNEYH
eukprot:4449962-Prymnesium_polylepis.1